MSAPDETPEVRVLYSKGCPGGPVSADILREVISERAPRTRLVLEERDHQELQSLGTPGSPTILLDGRDLFPSKTPVPFDAVAPCCRLYATPEGFRSHPTAGMVREALGAAGL